MKSRTRGLAEIKKPSIAGDKNPRWAGGVIVTKDGRTMIYSRGHPYPNSGPYVYRYRLVLEKHLGRFLLPEEVVHHINGDNTDDRVENLQVMTNLEHSLHHGRLMQESWSKSHTCCVQCGTKESKHKGHGLCTRCTDKKRWPLRKKTHELAKTS